MKESSYSLDYHTGPKSHFQQSLTILSSMVITNSLSEPTPEIATITKKKRITTSKPEQASVIKKMLTPNHQKILVS